MAFFQSHPDRDVIAADKIVNAWSTLIPRGAGQGEKFLEEVEKSIAEFDIPNTTVDRREFVTRRTPAHGTIGAEGPEVRIALRVLNTELPMSDYHTFFSARDFGKHLIVSQIVAGKQTGTRNQFERDTLGAYFTIINTIRDVAAEKFSTAIGQKKMDNQKGAIDIA